MRKCSYCGGEFDRIGNHWSHYLEHKPDFTEKQLEILKGVMMGGGTLHGKSEKNPYVLVAMTNKEYLKFLKEEFGELGKDVFLKQTSEESAEAMRKNGLRPNAKAENYKPVYRWGTRSHSKLHYFREWYKESGKVIPEDVNLTKTVLKHWYVCDGSLKTNGNFYCVSIALTEQRNNREAINKLFEKAGLPAPIWRERDADNKRTEICWNKEASAELLDYMGSPPPGFEYKWPE